MKDVNMRQGKLDYETVLRLLKSELDKRLREAESQVDLLSDILIIDKSNIRRRLSGRTRFSIDEFIRICSALNIPLTNFENEVTKKQFTMREFCFELSDREDTISLLETGIAHMLRVNNSNDAVFMQFSQIIPHAIFLQFEPVKEFYVLRWLYHCHEYTDIHQKTAAVLEDPTIQSLLDMYIESVKKVSEAVFILIKDMIPSIADDILFFHDIGLIDTNRVNKCREGLEQVLDYLENSASKGIWDDANRRKFTLYVSHISNTNSITTVESSGLSWTSVGVNCFNFVLGMEPGCIEMSRNWINSFIRSSDLISITGEKRRREYFGQQRQALQRLML